MRCKGITFCTSYNECVQKMHFLERFYLFTVLFLHKSKRMCNVKTPQHHNNIPTSPYYYIAIQINFYSILLKIPKNALNSLLLLDVSQF